MARYDLHQQTFVLSMAVNLASGEKGSARDIEKALKQKLQTLLGTAAIKDLIGEWSLVWGPAVWQHPFDLRGYSDNAIAVFHNAASDTTVCAIAATNANSIFDWAVEDFWVSDKVRWQYSPADGVPWLSAATNFGIGMLLTLRDPQTGAFLPDYLNSEASTGTSLIFAGHSLAGALSPSLAMLLYGTQSARQEWKQVLVYPTAGASPGNAAFARAFAEQFPPQTTGSQPWQRWNTLLWNRLDVVPHAWCLDRMVKVPTLYHSSKLVKAELIPIVAYCLYTAGPDYAGLSNLVLQGTQRPGTIDDIMEFLKEMGYQHVEAYFPLLGVPEIAPYAAVSASPSLQSLLAAQGQAARNAAAVAASGVQDSLKF
ncbi:MAG: lipase family protein [Bacteroidota bacterium]